MATHDSTSPTRGSSTPVAAGGTPSRTTASFNGRIYDLEPAEDVDPGALSPLPAYRPPANNLFGQYRVPPEAYVPEGNTPTKPGDQLRDFRPAVRRQSWVYLFTARFFQTPGNHAFPDATLLTFEWCDAKDGDIVCCNCFTKPYPDRRLRRLIKWFDAHSFRGSQFLARLHIRVHSRETRTYLIGRMRGKDDNFYLEALDPGVAPVRPSSTVFLGILGTLTNDRPVFTHPELVVVQPLSGGAA